MRLLQSVVIQQEVLEDLGPSIVAFLKKERDQFGSIRGISSTRGPVESRGLGIGLGDSAWEK